MLALIWFLYMTAAILIFQNRIDPEGVRERHGYSVDGECARTGLRQAVRARIIYSNQLSESEEFVWLSVGLECDPELLEKFNQTEVIKIHHKNMTLGFIADGTVVLDRNQTESMLSEYSSSLIYLFLLTIVISIGVAYYPKNEQSKP